MGNVLKILYLEDSPQDIEILKELLLASDIEMELDCTYSEKEFVNFLTNNKYDVVLSDFKLPGFDGFTALQISLKICPDVPFIIVSGIIGEEKAIELIKLGAADFILKDRMVRLPNAILNAIERKQMEEALRLSNERVHRIFNSFQDAFFQADMSGKFILASPSVLQIYGYQSMDEIIGMPAVNLYANDLIRENLLKELSEKGFVKDFVGQGKKKDGSTFWVSMNVQYLYSNGKISGTEGVVRDITERKQAEEALVESEKRLLSVLDSTPFPVAVVDINDDRIDYWSQSAIELFGHTASTASEWYLLAYPDPEYRNDVTLRWKSFLEKAKSTRKRLNTGEYNVTCKDGSVRICELYVNFLTNSIIVTFNDITERKQVEENLKENSSRLNLAMQSAKMAWWEMDITTGLVSFEKRKAEMLGYLPEQFNHYKDFMALVHPEDYEICMNAMHKHLDGSVDKYEVEYRILNKKGDYKWFYDVGSVVKNDFHGNPLKVTGLVIDISDRKLLSNVQEFMLKCGQPGSGEDFFESLAKFLSVTLEMEYVCIDRLEGDGHTATTVAVYNQGKYETNVSYTLKETPCGDVVGKNICCFPENVCSLFPYDQALQDLKAVSYIGTTLWSYDGNPIGLIALIGQKPLKNVVLVEAVLKQVSIRAAGELERKQAEIVVRESKDFIDKIINSLASPIFVKDDKSRFCLVNNALCTLLNLRPEDLIGTTDSDHFPDDQNEVFLAKDKEVFDTGKENISEEFITDGTGKIRTIITRKTSYTDIVGNKYLVGVINDITDRKKIELELIKAKEQAEESDKLKSAFLANMSHEIRTPMNGILGFAELLKEPKLSGEKQLEYIRIIEKSGDRMLNIINDIVSISKIESGILETYISETNINEQIEYVYNLLKLDAEKKKLKLILNNGLAETDSIVKTDTEKFIIILSNLVKNAIKYTDHGSIEFGYALKRRATPDEQNYLEFYVKDTGIGIPIDRQEAVFERFVQADISDKMARQGAGLGLAISKAYVALLGGKLWLESEVGKGTTFYFTIPYDAVSKQNILIENTDLADSETHINNLKILIAEDDESSEILLSTLVEMYSKEILKVSTGEAAVDYCRNNKDIDLILMDIQMNDLNGYEATKQIRQFNKNVVIIAQTAFGLSGDRDKAMRAGCNDYISKPINKLVLRALIQRHFGK